MLIRPGRLGRLASMLLLPIVCLTASAAKPEPLRVGVAESIYPFSYRLDDGRLDGAVVRTLALVSKESGIPFAVEGYPWSRAQMMVQKDELDAFVAVATRERGAYALFAHTPLLSAPHGIFYRPGNAALAHVASIEQLTRFRQGGFLGDGWVKEHFPADHIQWARSYEDLLRMIEAGRIDYVVGDAASADSRLKTLGLEGKLVFRSLPFLAPLDNRIGVRRSYPGAKELIARIERAIVKVRAGSEFTSAAPPYH